MDGEKLAQLYKTISTVAFSLAGVSLVAAVICFLKFNIIKIINDLSGRTAKKAISKRRLENEQSGNKAFRPSPKAKERGTKTDVMQDSRKLAGTQKIKSQSNETAVLDEHSTELLINETAVLTETYATELLSNETEVLSNATTVLSNETTVLTNENISAESVVKSKIEMLQNIVLIHTNEVI